MKIAIFAGHGGDRPGAVDPVELEENDGVYYDEVYSKESDIVLKASIILNEILQGLGHETIMPRTNDEYVSLYKRVDMANNNQSDIVISIHCNAAYDEQANGIETLYYPTSKEGKGLARYIQNELIYASEQTNRGIKARDDLFVLKKTDMPAVLVELGFLSNIQEEKLLNDDCYLEVLMQAIAKGVERYDSKRRTEE